MAAPSIPAVNASGKSVSRATRRHLVLGSLAIASAIALLWVGIQSYFSHSELEQIMRSDFRVQELRVSIGAVEQASILAAYMAAFTGDPAWEERYKKNDAQLDRELDEVASLMSTYDKQSLADVHTADAALDRMVFRLLDYVHKGQLKEAQALVLTGELEKVRAPVCVELDEFTAEISKYLDGQIASKERTSSLFLFSALLLFSLFIATCLMFVRVLRIDRKAAEGVRAQFEEQLRQSQKIEAVGQLAGGIAHDFNNLLTVINGRSELLLRLAKPDERMRRGLEMILSTGQRAAELTRQLLAFSRQQMLQPKVLDLSAVARGVESMLRRMIREDIRLVTRLEPALQSVKADPGQIEQVLMNLVVNARDAMPNGGMISIETSNVCVGDDFGRAHSKAKAGAYVLLAVSDTGHGMDAATKARIFEPFFTTKPKDKGTGLGLSTVYGIVTQSGGIIEVESAPGQGATFGIYLPATVETAPALMQQPPSSAHFDHGVVLVVEDEASVRALTREVLESSGYTVLSAQNADEALSVCLTRKEPIDLLLTDVVMPGMNGLDLAQRIKAIRPHIKALFTSGYTDQTIADSIAHVAFIQKPFTACKLSAKVREVLAFVTPSPSTAALQAP